MSVTALSLEYNSPEHRPPVGDEFSEAELAELEDALYPSQPDDGSLHISASGAPVERPLIVPEGFAGLDARGLQAGLSEHYKGAAEKVVDMHQENIKMSRLQAVGSITLAAVGILTTGGTSAIVLGVVPCLLEGARSVYSSLDSHRQLASASAPNIAPKSP